MARVNTPPGRIAVTAGGSLLLTNTNWFTSLRDVVGKDLPLSFAERPDPDEKFTPEQILRSMLEPSTEINEKFQTTSFLLDSGNIVSGMIIEETSEVVKVVVDPLANVEPATIDKTAIEARSKSSVSIMPKGLLSKLTREEILDLIAYVYARGDKKHMLFHSEHKH